MYWREAQAEMSNLPQGWLMLKKVVCRNVSLQLKWDKKWQTVIYSVAHLSDFIGPRKNSISECEQWYICSLFFILVISWKTELFINRSLFSPGTTTHTKGGGCRASSALTGVINLQGRAYSEKTGCVKLQSAVTTNTYKEKQSWVS